MNAGRLREKKDGARPGIFLRRDDANAMSFYLQSVIERLEKGEQIDPLSIMFLKGLAKMLEECRVP